LPHSNPHTALDQLELPHKHPGSPSLFKGSPQQHCRDSAFCPHSHTTLGQHLGRNLEKTRKATNPRKTPVPKLTPHYTRSIEDQRRKNQTAFKEERGLPKHWLTPMGGANGGSSYHTFSNDRPFHPTRNQQLHKRISHRIYKPYQVQFVTGC
jgi:hypothetical protein